MAEDFAPQLAEAHASAAFQRLAGRPLTLTTHAQELTLVLCAVILARRDPRLPREWLRDFVDDGIAQIAQQDSEMAAWLRAQEG